MSNETDIQERRGEQWMRDNPRCTRCGHRHSARGIVCYPDGFQANIAAVNASLDRIGRPDLKIQEAQS